MKDEFVRCSPLEVSTGWMYGFLAPVPLPERGPDPRPALDDALRPALAAAPCFVTFSGGRDSSAVLAAATDLARREGHALPVPVTRVYPQLPETDETSWQEAVVDHLGLPEWIRLEFSAEETDLLGEAAQDGLRRRGLLWPPALQAHGAMFSRIGPGSLVTGEGGDAVLGMHRVTPLVMMRRRAASRRRLVPPVLTALAPRGVRRAIARRMVRTSVQSRWLTSAALADHARRAADDASAEPLRYDNATWLVTRRRSFATISHNHAAAAAEFGLTASDPLLDRGFVAALAHAGGRWGYPGRTAVMQALFADVLPGPVLARSTKASFNFAHTGSATREFARSWDGSGVDPELVDPERLREVWLSNSPTMAAGVLLHGAWLATQGVAAWG